MSTLRSLFIGALLMPSAWLAYAQQDPSQTTTVQTETHAAETIPAESPVAAEADTSAQSIANVSSVPEPKLETHTVQTTGTVQKGIASWYGPGFHGRRTASGHRFDMHAISVAHRTLPLLSYVRITLIETGTQIVAQITDRGPYVKGRIVDLSKGAAMALGMTIGKGLAHVALEPLISH